MRLLVRAAIVIVSLAGLLALPVFAAQDYPSRPVRIIVSTPAGGPQVTVEVTSSPFNLPVCGAGGAGSSTVSTFHPVNMCVRKGDYVEGACRPASNS